MSIKYGIVETVLQCSYPFNMRDYIANVIIELTAASPSAKVLKVSYKNENIVLVKYNAKTTFKNRIYEIPILIYMMKNMPYEAPEVYLERSSDTGVNPKNIDIDQRTNRIMTKSLVNWTSYTNLSTVLTEITNSFNANFPIYKLTNTNMNNSGLSNTEQNYNMNTSGMYNYQQPISSSYVPQNEYNYNTMNKNNMTNYNPSYQPESYSNVYKNPSYSNVNTYSNPNTNKVNPSPTSYSNFLNNLSTNKPPAKNTIYQNLYADNISKSYNQPSQNVGHNNYSNIYSNYNQPQNFSNTFGDGGNVNNYNNYGNNYSNTNSNTSSNTNTFSNFIGSSDYNLDGKKEEAEIKMILIDEIKASLESKIKEEMKRNKQTEDKLKNYKNEFGAQIEKYKKHLDRKEEIVNAFDSFMTNSEKEIQETQIYLAKMRDRMVDATNFESHMIISNTVLLRLLAIEATMEDFFSIIRKALEKGVLNFSETSKIMRTLTREAFKIKAYREKIMKSI